MIIKCGHIYRGHKDCPINIIILGEGVAPGATYTCKNHTLPDDSSVHFQDCQFDRQIGSGTDPKAYERGTTYSAGRGEPRHLGENSRKQQFDKKIEESLVGHENAEAILKILKADVRK
jgi:hypothetical protein